MSRFQKLFNSGPKASLITNNRIEEIDSQVTDLIKKREELEWTADLTRKGGSKLIVFLQSYRQKSIEALTADQCKGSGDTIEFSLRHAQNKSRSDLVHEMEMTLCKASDELVKVRKEIDELYKEKKELLEMLNSFNQLG